MYWARIGKLAEIDYLAKLDYWAKISDGAHIFFWAIIGCQVIEYYYAEQIIFL